MSHVVQTVRLGAVREDGSRRIEFVLENGERYVIENGREGAPGEYDGAITEVFDHEQEPDA